MRNTQLTSTIAGVRPLRSDEMEYVSGGIWDYSNRLGMLGQLLEDAQDRRYGDPLGPKTLDQAAHQALEGWISVP
jgi:hypothetical protein